MDLILRNKKTFAFLFWIWLFAILYFTFMPNSPKMTVDYKKETFRLDYLLHFFVYLSLSVLFFLWRANNLFKLQFKEIAFYLTIGILICGLSEYIQIYIPGRSFNLNDFYFNIAGIIVGVIAPKMILRNNTQL
jgi:VanZ family protein